jgi:hypothetical protein
MGITFEERHDFFAGLMPPGKPGLLEKLIKYVKGLMAKFKGK